jgi:hypothetical protein
MSFAHVFLFIELSIHRIVVCKILLIWGIYGVFYREYLLFGVWSRYCDASRNTGRRLAVSRIAAQLDSCHDMPASSDVALQRTGSTLVPR